MRSLRQTLLVCQVEPVTGPVPGLRSGFFNWRYQGNALIERGLGRARGITSRKTPIAPSFPAGNISANHGRVRLTFPLRTRTSRHGMNNLPRDRAVEHAGTPKGNLDPGTLSGHGTMGPAGAGRRRLCNRTRTADRQDRSGFAASDPAVFANPTYARAFLRERTRMRRPAVRECHAAKLL
jgi:hypothetical protein